MVRARQDGLRNVAVEKKFPEYKRRVDVYGEKPPAKDPRYNEVVHREVKAGSTTRTSRILDEVSKDARQLADNRAVRRGSQILSKGGRVLRPVGMVMDTVNVGKAFRADGNRVGVNTGRAVSGLAGGAGGAWGGASIGATIGTMVAPGVGTVIGGAVGGIIGGLAGDAAGRGLFGAVRKLF